jgi:hypothetical protein
VSGNFLDGHEEDSNPLGLEPRDTPGSTEMPENFYAGEEWS